MEKNSNGRKIIGGALWLTLSGLIVKALGLFYKIPLSYVLSDEGMSYFNSAYTVYTFFYIICTAGIPKSISILVSEADGRGDNLRVARIYKTAFFFFTALGAVVTVLFFLIALPLAKIIGSAKSGLAMLAISPSVAFTCAAGVIRGYFSGKMNFAPLAISEAISGVSRLVLGLALALLGYRMGYDLSQVAALTVLGTSLGSFFGFLYLYRVRHKENIGFKLGQKYTICHFESSIARKITRIAIPITFTCAVGSLSSIIDLVVIMNRLNASGYSELQSGIMYGNYTTLVIPMLNLVATLIMPLSTVLLPIVSKESVRENPALLSEKIYSVIKVTFFICIPSAFLFLLRPREILSILFEDSSAIMAAPSLALLAPGVVFMCLLSVVNTALEGIGNTKIPLISLLTGSIVKLIITFILIKNNNLGMFGAPVGTAAAYFVSFLVSAYYLLVVKRVRLRLFAAFIPSFIGTVIAIATSSIYKAFVGKENMISYVLELLVFGLLYLCIVFLSYFKYIKEQKNSNIHKKITI